MLDSNRDHKLAELNKKGFIVKGNLATKNVKVLFFS